MFTWRATRQISYLLGVVVFFLVIGLTYYWFNLPEPNCFDGIQNQDETGVDCGGVCERICSADVAPLRVMWARSFEVTPGVYSAVALLENPNVREGVFQVPYNFRLLSAAGETIEERSGITKALPERRFVVFESNIIAPPSSVNRTLFDIYPDLYWQEVSQREPLIRASQRSFINEPFPRLVANVTNETVEDFPRVRVVVVLSDASGNAFAASATLVENLQRRSTREIVFTWPRPFSFNPTFVDFYPSVLDPGF